MKVEDLFLELISYPTQSVDNAAQVPSSPGQLAFAKILVEKCKQTGCTDVTLSPHGYVMATLPGNTDCAYTLGFIAHMDTSPDCSGDNIRPQIIRAYDGKDIVLRENIVLSVNEFPELKKYIGQDIITTDGATLLGADDKAGVSCILTALSYLQAHPEIAHGPIRICFTPDEEVGRGADYFDVDAFGCDFAYTIDGGEIGELEYENFYAARAEITFTGKSVHPGYAKNKMVNAVLAATEYIAMLPKQETPACTEGREGFFHTSKIEGSVERAVIKLIIRDFDQPRFEERKALLFDIQNAMQARYGPAICQVAIKDEYENMLEKIKPHFYVVELARKAMAQAGVKPLERPIRGGTDGARISFMGLPCPNIFAGGHNFHGPYEFVPVQSMEKCVEVLINIARLTLDLKKD